MFDDKPTTAAATPPKDEAQAAPLKEQVEPKAAVPDGGVEDIFSDVDKEPVFAAPSDINKTSTNRPAVASVQALPTTGKNKKWLFIVFIIIAVAVIGAAAAMFLIKFGETEDPAAPEAVLPAIEETGGPRFGPDFGQPVIDVSPSTVQPTDALEPTQTPSEIPEPVVVDTDNDGLNDTEEAESATNPLKADTDGDDLSDYDEVKVYRTDPLDSDSDNDGFLDGEEIKNGYNPKGPGKLLNVE